MLGIRTEMQHNKCRRCGWKFGPQEPADWMQVSKDGEPTWEIWCILCTDDVRAGSNVDWDKFTGYVCDRCEGLATVEDAKTFGWLIDPGWSGVTCPFCRQVLKGKVDDPIPLSCLPKSQEFQDPTQSKGGIPIWLQGLVLMGLFISTGLFWIPLALSLALVYTGMVIWRRYEKRKTANLPHQKRRGAE